MIYGHTVEIYNTTTNHSADTAGYSSHNGQPKVGICVQSGRAGRFKLEGLPQWARSNSGKRVTVTTRPQFQRIQKAVSCNSL